MHTKKILLLLVSKGSKLSLAAVPSSKGSSTGSVCVKVVYEFACCLCATCPLLSHHSVFSIAAVCCSDCDIFSSTFVVRTPQYRPTQLLLTKDSRHKFLRHSLLSQSVFISGLASQIRVSRRYYPLRVFISGIASLILGVHFVGRSGTFHRGWCSFQGVFRIFVVRGGTILVVVHTHPRQSLASLSLDGVHFRACFADSWVAESAHSVSRRYYPLIGRSPGVPLLRVLLVSCRGLCYLLAQAQALERSYLRVRPGGLSTANT